MQPYKTGAALLNGASHYVDTSIDNNNVISRMCNNVCTPGTIEKYTKQKQQLFDSALY